MTEREQIAEDVRAVLQPLIELETHEGGYDCGCGTYQSILDHAIAIILGGRDAWPPPEPY